MLLLVSHFNISCDISCKHVFQACQLLWTHYLTRSHPLFPDWPTKPSPAGITEITNFTCLLLSSAIVKQSTKKQTSGCYKNNSACKNRYTLLPPNWHISSGQIQNGFAEQCDRSKRTRRPHTAFTRMYAYMWVCVLMTYIWTAI